MRPRLDYYNKINPITEYILLSIAGSESEWILFHIPFAEDFCFSSIYAEHYQTCKTATEQARFYFKAVNARWGTWKEGRAGEE
jgi:hypothetical protein